MLVQSLQCQLTLSASQSAECVLISGFITLKTIRKTSEMNSAAAWNLFGILH